MEKVQGDADEWRAVLGDALKHVTTIIDFVPFNAKFATREEQGKVKESIAEFLEMLGEHQAHTPLIQITHTTRASDIRALYCTPCLCDVHDARKSHVCALQHGVSYGPQIF